MKRRWLDPGQPVTIIFYSETGFVHDPAIFKRYDKITIGDVTHQTPVFEYQGKEITGMECFWVLPHEASDFDHLHHLQYHLIDAQIKALEIAQELGYTMPMKIKDPQIPVIAAANNEQLKAIIAKLGYDPRDESWIEAELAPTMKEKHWFRFERENEIIFSDDWDNIVAVFNKQFGDGITKEEAKALSKKRMRYILGAYNTRMSGNGDKDDWKKAAMEFEKFHRDRENRMLTWSMLHRDKYPRVRVKKIIPFWHGPYFHECLEKVPHIFTDASCKFIREGVILRVLSYDNEQKYIRLDFTPEVRQLLKPSDPDVKEPWVKDRADYDIWVQPSEINDHLDFLEKLD